MRSFILILLLPLAAPAEPSGIDVGQAQRSFADLDRACKADHGKLWGHSLCGPVMFVDPQTHAVLLNRVPGSVWKPGLFVSALVSNQGMANTDVVYEGVPCSQVLWPLQAAPEKQLALLLHESFHRLQAEQQWKANQSEGANAHLDSGAGRYLIQLEWRALTAALQASGAARAAAEADALLFRRARFAQFPVAAEQEPVLETNEGLAEYTGVKLSSPRPEVQKQLALADLAERPKSPSLVRSFAYASGPAYGLLLDATGGAWREDARSGTDLGALLARRAKLDVSEASAEEVEERAVRYGGRVLKKEEDARQAAREAKQNEAKATLVEGPTLELPLAGAQRFFNPSNLMPLPGHGTVYPTLRLQAPWGTLDVNSMALLDDEDGKVYVSAPRTLEKAGARGEGWALELNPGWKLVPGKRKGDLRLAQ